MQFLAARLASPKRRFACRIQANAEGRNRGYADHGSTEGGREATIEWANAEGGGRVLHNGGREG